MFRDEDSPAKPYLLLTCEHGGREVPAPYRRVFAGQQELLRTHRGSDIGALGVGLRMAARLSTPIVFSTVTRLLVDLNRSEDHPEVFSELSRHLCEQERQRVLEVFYRPYRRCVLDTIAAAIHAGHRVVHLGVHTCTDVLAGVRRELDIALLFDEARPHEAGFCEAYRSAILRQEGDLRCPFNQPYRGADDGLTTALRAQFAPEEYLGIEIEIRQGMVGRAAHQQRVGDLLSEAVSCVWATTPAP
ncbi:MAG: N-formylglutamate amidohydrolase [Phycisphaerales bacterium]